MPVRAARRIGVKALGQLGMQQVFLQAAPRARDAAFQIEDDLVEIDHPGRDQRAQKYCPVAALQPVPATSRAARISSR